MNTKTLGWIGRGLGLAGALAWALTSANAANFSLDATSGTVSVKGAATAKSATVGTELSTGDAVTTDKGASADLGLVVGGRKVSTLHIWSDSSYVVSETTDDEKGATKGGGSLTQGTVAGLFNPISSDSSLTVKASEVTATVQAATTFLVRSVGDVYCYNGRILVTLGGTTYTLTTGQAFMVSTKSIVPHNLPSPFSLVSAQVVQVISPTTSTSQPGGN